MPLPKIYDPKRTANFTFKRLFTFVLEVFAVSNGRTTYDFKVFYIFISDSSLEGYPKAESYKNIKKKQVPSTLIARFKSEATKL